MRSILIATCIVSIAGIVASSSMAKPLQTFPISRGQMQKWCGGTADGVVTGGGHSGCDVCGNGHCVDLDCNNKTGRCRGVVVAVTGRDYSVVMGITVLLSVIIIVANLVVDILYGYLDPRIRDERA